MVPGSDGAVTDDATARKVAAEIGYPVLIKAAAGGGGRGMKVAHERRRARQRARHRPLARRAPPSATTPSTSRSISPQPRHIEVQVIGDGKGGAVHLGERDCSLQRRHQKVLEEAPSPVINAEQRARIGGIVANAIA